MTTEASTPAETTEETTEADPNKEMTTENLKNQIETVPRDSYIQNYMHWKNRHFHTVKQFWKLMANIWF